MRLWNGNYPPARGLTLPVATRPSEYSFVVDIGLRFADYLGLCQQQFAAHDSSRLRSYMTEYSDHKLLDSSKVLLSIHIDPYRTILTHTDSRRPRGHRIRSI